MILLDEAVDRFRAAAAPYGVRLRQWSRLADPARWVREIEMAIEPLRLPDELRAFWLTWDPSTLVPPVLEGFIPLQSVAAERRLECPPCPEILLPIANAAHARIWIELAGDDHPGGRVFHSHHDETEVRLWAFGVSGLLDAVSACFECDGIDDRSGELDRVLVDLVVGRGLDKMLPNDAPRAFEGMDRSRQPIHWRAAEGIGPDHFSLQGATQTVAGLEERRRSGSLSATLEGDYRDVVGGGPLDGTVGVFRDCSGEVQVFVPRATSLRGAVGIDGRVEIDVIAVAPTGETADALPAKQALEAVGSVQGIAASAELFERLVSEMVDLDTSVIVTAMRPIR
ncbi:MAG: hypothetical protein ACR2P0_09130 [Acidimicrobiales bacterium]